MKKLFLLIVSEHSWLKPWDEWYKNFSEHLRKLVCIMYDTSSRYRRGFENK